MRRALAGQLRQDVDRVGVHVLHAGDREVAVAVRHELGVFVRPQALLAGGRDRDRRGRRALDGGKVAFRRRERCGVVGGFAVRDDDDEVLLAAVHDRADVGLDGAAVVGKRARGERTAGEGRASRGEIDRAAGIGLVLAVPGARAASGEIVVDLVHRERIGRVVALVAVVVERLDHVDHLALVGGGHLPDSVAQIAAVGTVVRASRFDEQPHADVEVVGQVGDDGRQRRLHAAVLRVERRRPAGGLAPVRGVVHEDQHVRPGRGECRVGEEDVGVVVDRVEHGPRGARGQGERGGEKRGQQSAFHDRLLCRAATGSRRRASGSWRPGRCGRSHPSPRP